MIEQIIALIFTQYGIVGVLGLLTAFLIFKNWAWVSSKLRLMFVQDITVNPNASFDILISKLDFWLNFKINNIYMRDVARREIFRDLVQIRFGIFRDHIVHLDQYDWKEMSPGELYSLVVKCLHDSIEEAEESARNHGIPDVVISKFRKWTSKNIEFTLKAMEMVCYSQVYGNNNGRMQAIYSLYTAMFEITIAEAERSLNELNGELDGVEYKGLVCCGH